MHHCFSGLQNMHAHTFAKRVELLRAKRAAGPGQRAKRAAEAELRAKRAAEGHFHLKMGLLSAERPYHKPPLRRGRALRAGASRNRMCGAMQVVQPGLKNLHARG